MTKQNETLDGKPVGENIVTYQEALPTDNLNQSLMLASLVREVNREMLEFLINLRINLRKQGNYELADFIRDWLNKHHIEIRDISESETYYSTGLMYW